MFLNTLDRKPLIRDGNGELIRDLTKSIFDFSNGNKLNMSVYRIPVGFEMRPDLVSQSVYNNTMYAEFVLKYNGISNPFALDEGDVILIPSLESAKKSLKEPDDLSGQSAAAQIRNSYRYIDPSKIPARDGNLDGFNNRNLDKLKSGDSDAFTNKTFGGNGSNNEDSINKSFGGNGSGTGQDSIQDGALPPNIAQEGESGITYRNGRVFFGEGIGQSACLKNGMSQGEFLTKVTKKKS